MALTARFLSYIAHQAGISTISKAVPVSGGSINQVYCLTAAGKYLLKVNSKSRFPGMFACEASGLNLIAAAQTIAVPQVILNGDLDDDSFLLLEWIAAKRPSIKSSQALGTQLAAMHGHSHDSFGLDGDNYMGSLKQSNNKHLNWADFFVKERLMPMVKMAAGKKLLTIADEHNFKLLYERLGGHFDEEPPSLIHGDLWNGNYLIGTDEKPYLIDPAVSYGHREFDIAMTTLFGGFSPEFYEAYDEAFPLNKGWQQRMALWNLYPLLVHLNLFGAGYLGQVRGCLGKFT